MIITEPGEVGHDDGGRYSDQRGWWTCCPTCGRSGMLTAHEVTFSYDEEKRYPVPNITPSCVCSCGAHWFVTKGEVILI